ncbi:MAG: ABC transporter permease [Firmicutes bacterium]|nr:ABC transporter permease [Bacillota bacterium]
MNRALLKATLKANYKIWITFLFILMIYSMIIIIMYNPDDMASWDALVQMLPPEMIQMMGFQLIAPTLTGFIAGYYYGFIILMFPIIYLSFLGQKIIARYVDTGSMSYLLSTPNSRQKIVVTQGFYLLSSILTLIIVVATINGLMAATLFPGLLDVKEYLLLNINLLALYVFLSGIVFLTSCIFNETRLATAYGTGILVGFFVIEMLSEVDSKLSFLKYFTVYTLFDSKKAIHLDSLVYLYSIFLILGGLLLYFLGIHIFKRKDLHI